MHDGRPDADHVAAQLKALLVSRLVAHPWRSWDQTDLEELPRPSAGHLENAHLRGDLMHAQGNRENIDGMAPGSQKILTQVMKLIDSHDLYGSVAYPKKHEQKDISDIYLLPYATRGIFTNVALQEPFGLTVIEARILYSHIQLLSHLTHVYFSVDNQTHACQMVPMQTLEACTVQALLIAAKSIISYAVLARDNTA